MPLKSPYFAAIDLGSNSFHMLIARTTDSRIEIIDREKDMVQIARGLRKGGKLDKDAQKRALACLQRFAERLQDIPKAQIRAVGTKALRTAANSQRFIKKAEKALGLPIQIISGFEEARLVYTGLSYTVVDEQAKRLVIDIGGGSTEFIIGQSNDMQQLESLSLGCVTFTEMYDLNPDNLSAIAMSKAYLNACGKLEQIRKQYLSEGWQITYGTSGTMRAIAELLGNESGGAVINRSSLDALIEKSTNNKTLEAPGIAKLRRDVLPAGLAILQAICDQFQIDKIQVADATLKEGLIYDSIGRFSNHDSRLETVSRLQQRYRIDTHQAEAVSRTALHLWRQIDDETELPGVSRTKILLWAAKLHEIGLSISHAGYHQHGYYILRNSDLAGFGRYEQTVLANLVRFHRKKAVTNKFSDLDDDAITAFIPLLVCLRLAILLHRRRELNHIFPTLKRRANKYTLGLDAKWLANHPLTQAGFELEIQLLHKIDVDLEIK